MSCGVVQTRTRCTVVGSITRLPALRRPGGAPPHRSAHARGPRCRRRARHRTALLWSSATPLCPTASPRRIRASSWRSLDPPQRPFQSLSVRAFTPLSVANSAAVSPLARHRSTRFAHLALVSRFMPVPVRTPMLSGEIHPWDVGDPFVVARSNTVSTPGAVTSRLVTTRTSQTREALIELFPLSDLLSSSGVTRDGGGSSRRRDWLPTYDRWRTSPAAPRLCICKPWSYQVLGLERQIGKRRRRRVELERRGWPNPSFVPASTSAIWMAAGADLVRGSRKWARRRGRR